MGSWNWDISNNAISWSDHIFRIYDIEPQAFAGTFEAFLESIHPDDRDHVQTTVNRVLTENAAYDIPYRIVRPDGEERMVRQRGEIICDASGAAIRMLGTLQDVTEQTAAAEAVRQARDDLEMKVEERTRDLQAAESRALQSEAQLNSAIETMSEGFALYDSEERLVLCNNHYPEMFPVLSRVDGFFVSGMKFEDLVRAGAERGRVVAAKGRVEEYVRERMGKFRNPAGPFEFQQTRGNWIRSEERKIPGGGIVCIRSDVTEKKQAEAALRKSEAQLRSIIDNSPYYLSLKGLDNKYRLVNEAYARKLNISVEEAIGKTAADFEEVNETLAIETHDREVIETGNTVTTAA